MEIFGRLPIGKIIGVALPLNSIKDVLNGKDKFADQEEISRLKETLIELKKICDSLGLRTFNSEVKDFTDRLDEQYSAYRICEEDVIEI